MALRRLTRKDVSGLSNSELIELHDKTHRRYLALQKYNLQESHKKYLVRLHIDIVDELHTRGCRHEEDFFLVTWFYWIRRKIFGRKS